MALTVTSAPNNTYRFMPCRAEEDGRILFKGLRYSRQAVKTDKGFLAGVGLGPGQHQPVDEQGPGFQLTPGGVIVPARPNEKSEPVPVRDFEFKNEGNKVKKQYIDFATFKKIGDQLFAIPFEEDHVAYFEIWTGDIMEKEETYQFVQADMFSHGSVTFSGDSMIVVDAPSRKRGQKSVGNRELENVRASAAEMVGESVGRKVGGIPLWLTRLWRVHYSAKDSEAILVRQLGKFYLLMMRGDEPQYTEVPASKFEKRFENLLALPIAA